MRLNELHDKLIAAARATPLDDRVPYMFEKRIMAKLLAPAPVADDWALWGRALWRACAPCVAIMLLMGVWTMSAPQSPEPADNLSQALEDTVVFSTDHFSDAW
jgi:hypothetical protein